MNSFIKVSVFPALLVGGLLSATVQAAPRAADPNSKVVVKLQTIVKDMTSERDLLKTEKEKLAAEIEQVKKDKSAADATASSVEERLSGELAAQKSSAEEVRAKLEKAGYSTYVHVAQTKEGKRTRVRIGPFATKQEAQKIVGKIKSLNFNASVLTL